MQNRRLLSIPNEFEQSKAYEMFRNDTPHTVIMDKLNIPYTKVMAYRISYERMVANEVRSKADDNQKQ